MIFKMLGSHGMQLHAQGAVRNMITLFHWKFNSEPDSEEIWKIRHHLSKLWAELRTTLFIDSHCRLCNVEVTEFDGDQTVHVRQQL